jgi:hypothetical protein
VFRGQPAEHVVGIPQFEGLCPGTTADIQLGLQQRQLLGFLLRCVVEFWSVIGTSGNLTNDDVSQHRNLIWLAHKRRL